MRIDDADLFAMEADMRRTARLFRRGRAYMAALAWGHLAVGAWIAARLLLG